MDRRADQTYRPGITFSVYQQVATRRFIDEQSIWTVMRFADEPEGRVQSRQLTRVNVPTNVPTVTNPASEYLIAGSNEDQESPD